MTAAAGCGSLAAYWRHRRAGEEPCQACKTATTGHIRQRAAERQRALQRLAKEYPQRYRELLAEERARPPAAGTGKERSDQATAARLRASAAQISAQAPAWASRMRKEASRLDGGGA